MPESNFDIYQTEAGYTAVTNDVRRLILQSLAQRELGLPDLVEITGKAKPTLSSVHMKELLAQKLVEELPHPTDNRKKIYRLRARRIGSSSVPVDQLRSAVRHYVNLSPLAGRLPLPVLFDALLAAPPDAGPAVLAPQARRLGELVAPQYAQHEARDLVRGVSSFLEQEGLARPLRLDLEHRALDLEWGQALPADADPARVATLLASFVDGVLRARTLADDPAQGRPLDGARRVRLSLPPERPVEA